MKYILLLPLVSLLFSCEKGPETKVESSCELKTINFDTAQNGFFNVTTSGNNIVQLTFDPDNQTKQVYSFNSQNQFVKREDFTNLDNLGATLVRHRFEHFYDASNNLIKTITSHRMYSGGVALGFDVWIDSFFLHSSGHSGEMKSYSVFNGTNIYQGKTIFTWANNDLQSLKQYGHIGQLYHTVDFTYDLTKENRFDSVISKNFYIQELFEYGHKMEGIRRSKHILTSSIEQWSGSPVTSNFITKFNSRGFIESIQDNSFGRTDYIFRFGYLCN